MNKRFDKETLHTYGNIMELRFGLSLSAFNIAERMGMPVSRVENILDLYTQPLSEDLTLQSKVNYSWKDWYIYDNWDKLSIQQMAEVLATSTVTVKRMGYQLNLDRKTRVVDTAPNCTYRSRTLVLNTETGIYYFSNNEAADTRSLNRSYFKTVMAGYRRNRTPFIKV